MLTWERPPPTDPEEVPIFSFPPVTVCCAFIPLLPCKNCGKSGLFPEEDPAEKGPAWLPSPPVLGLKGDDMPFPAVFPDNDCPPLLPTLKGEFTPEPVLNVDPVPLFPPPLVPGLNGDDIPEPAPVPVPPPFVPGLNGDGIPDPLVEAPKPPVPPFVPGLKGDGIPDPLAVPMEIPLPPLPFGLKGEGIPEPFEFPVVNPPLLVPAIPVLPPELIGEGTPPPYPVPGLKPPDIPPVPPGLNWLLPPDGLALSQSP